MAASIKSSSSDSSSNIQRKFSGNKRATDDESSSSPSKRQKSSSAFAYANLIEDIVGNISRRLINLLPSVIEEQLVGIKSRVEEIYKLLELELDDRGTPYVEGIILDSKGYTEEITHLKPNGKSFSGMSNLRLLIINVDFHLSEDLEFLSNELRLLQWHGYHLKSLPSSFQPQKLVQLNLRYSHIEYLWKDIKPSMEYLKTVNLSFSYNLIKTPDFEMIPNLERLDLQCCTKLREVHKSVGSLGKLIVLNFNGCSNLVVFLSDVSGLKSLKILNLNGCSNLDTLPLNLEEVEPLEELDISGTAIKQIVISSIVMVDVANKKVWLHGFDVASPCRVKAQWKQLVSLPDSISQLSRLTGLYLEKCQRLKSLPKLPPYIVAVVANDCTSLKTISSALELDSGYTWLQFSNCFQLVESQGRNNSLEIMLQKRWLQINEIHYAEFMSKILFLSAFHLNLPGSEIPELFSYWSEGSTITWPQAHCWLNDEFIGFSVCAVMSIPSRLYGPRISCCFGSSGIYYPCSNCKGDDHLWLVYFSKNALYHKDRQYNCGQGITARFEILDNKGEKEYNNNVVKRCGIRPVYKQDVEFLEELSATDGAITMPSTLQGRRFRKCSHRITAELKLSNDHVDYSEDSSVEEDDIGTAAGDIGNSIYI
ncbi:hypothetical protein EZV62_011885 [Acer yangbiense]|uniref:C-JID domain-containing protein n=1 Tax=Acer yangbiense TaxID=1000413 RepID=A0A5C7I6J4_9ROSI|nr:hypothetical protein EZV62_011885 [Acer yangbiense]